MPPTLGVRGIDSEKTFIPLLLSTVGSGMIGKHMGFLAHGHCTAAPSQAIPSGSLPQNSHLQWRDRAGFKPASPSPFGMMCLQIIFIYQGKV